MAVTSEQLYEQTLVLRSPIGDEATFGELLKLYGPRLLRFAERMMQSSPDQIADLTQDIWVAIFRGLHGRQDPGKFRPWASRIARDRIYREYRRRKLPTQPLDETVLAELPERLPQPNSAISACSALEDTVLAEMLRGRNLVGMF